MPAINRQEEFLRLFEPVRENLSRFARALARDRQDAHDLVGEAVLLAYENFDKLKNKESFKSYIFTITIRIFKRRNWRRRLFSSFDEPAAINVPDIQSPPGSGHDVEMLYKALDKLPGKQKQALVLFEISGFSIEEIREIQGGTASGVKSRLKRGREKLTEILNPAAEKNLFHKNGHQSPTVNGYHSAAGSTADINSVKNEPILKVRK